jgi:hypothetical protein
MEFLLWLLLKKAADNIYIPIGDRWLVFNNMDLIPEIIAQGYKFGKFVSNSKIWPILKSKYNNER